MYDPIGNKQAPDDFVPALATPHYSPVTAAYPTLRRQDSSVIAALAAAAVQPPPAVDASSTATAATSPPASSPASIANIRAEFEARVAQRQAAVDARTRAEALGAHVRAQTAAGQWAARRSSRTGM